MFIDLINLFNKHSSSNKTPLEDFNTECFANILRLYKDIKHDFIRNILELPKDNYVIKTQLKRDLPDNRNCLIDLVFIGNKNVCFIENKVESGEGYEQLKRYGDALVHHYKKYGKYLFYITKYNDPKNEDGKLNKFNFTQFKWFEISNFLRTYQTDNPLINDYLKFLNKYKMEQDNTFRSENLLSMENMAKTIEIIESHIENSKYEFNKLFGSAKYDKNFNWDQIRVHNRLCHLNYPILKCEKNRPSEILYCIDLNNLKLKTHIWVDQMHEQYENVTKLEISEKEIKSEITSGGAGIKYYVEKDLGLFLNSNNSDEEIKNWFLWSFEIMHNLIKDNPQLDWQLK